MRSNRLYVAAALTALLAACQGTGPMGASGGSNIPSAIAVPSGNRLAFTLTGSGLLSYECRARPEAAGGYDWVLAAPEAVLKDKDTLVGRYYGGPTWEHGDGSKVTGRQLALAPAPTPGSLPWQLVQANPSPGSATFNGVTYIQRINTQAGVAPSDTCNATALNTKKQVRYSADYLFYKG